MHPSHQRSRRGGGSCPLLPGELWVVLGIGLESPHDGDRGHCQVPTRAPRDSGSSHSHANPCFLTLKNSCPDWDTAGCSFLCKWYFFASVLHLSPLALLFKRQGLQEGPYLASPIATSIYTFLLCLCYLPSFPVQIPLFSIMLQLLFA